MPRAILPHPLRSPVRSPTSRPRRSRKSRRSYLTERRRKGRRRQRGQQFQPVKRRLFSRTCRRRSLRGRRSRSRPSSRKPRSSRRCHPLSSPRRFRTRRESRADWVGKRVEYALIYTNRKKRASPPSSVVQIEPMEELEVPGAPVASVGDGRVELRWETGTPSDEALFDVYRRDGDAESYSRKTVNPIPVGSHELIDEAIVFGRPICYGVRRVVPPPAPTGRGPTGRSAGACRGGRRGAGPTRARG